jgi:hypothetical protein
MEKEMDIITIQAKLDDLNKLIKPYQLAYVNPVKDCVPLEKNARYFEKDMLDKLTANVAEDGFLSQLPFGMKRNEDGKYLILSGNHRLKASIKAKLEYILILYIDEVSKDKQIAYQLSHNALVGKDDMQMLKEIYAEMASIEAREFSGLNGVEFIDVEKISTSAIGDGDIELTEMKFLFVESRKNEVNTVLSELEKQDTKDYTGIVYGSFEEFIKTLTEVKKVYGIKSNTVAFGRMIDICHEKLAEEKEKEAEA